MKVRILVVGVGNMGASHARAYREIAGYEIVGLVARSAEKRNNLAEELGVANQFSDYKQAIRETSPDAVSINTYPDTHEGIALYALEHKAHVFLEKPMATTVDGAIRIAQKAQENQRKVVIGYILRHHPSWSRFVELSHSLGKPLVMRMNLNQQSYGALWGTHKELMKSMSPIVDCGVHYVDIMCQMTRSIPVKVYATGTRLSEEIEEEMYNYGMLQVTFQDGSIGWYESGWGPMMSKTAYFVKDVIGPRGSVSIAEPSHVGQDIENHVKTSQLVVHHMMESLPDETIHLSQEPDHQDLCNLEQEYFLKAIKEDLDLENHLQDAISSLRIVLAADESVRTGKVVDL